MSAVWMMFKYIVAFPLGSCYNHMYMQINVEGKITRISSR